MNLNLNLTPSPFVIQHQIGNGNFDPLLDPNNPSSSPVPCHIFFDSARDHNMLYYHDDHPELYESQHTSDENHGNFDHGGSTYEVENNRIDQSGLKVTLWKKEDHQEERVNDNPLRWMSSKMRLMYKIKNNQDHLALKITKNKIENQTSYFESGNKLKCSDSSYTSHISPVRVCSDCNTTKTPLWRSGPKGPKSLCNACGIRQRKARRAMAMAAAANGTAVVASNHQIPATTKIKVRHKGNNTHFKKRCKIVTGESKKIGFEDFVINLSKNLSFHRVFPEDERDAAILLMALSSGLVSS